VGAGALCFSENRGSNVREVSRDCVRFWVWFKSYPGGKEATLSLRERGGVS